MSTTVPHIESVPHERADTSNEKRAAKPKRAPEPVDPAYEQDNADTFSPLAVPVIGSLFVVAGASTSSSVLASTGVMLLVLAAGAWVLRGH